MLSFAADSLDLAEPEVRPLPYATPSDRAACRDLIKTGSHSFYSASLLLPEALREAAYALYGFCRLSDDAVDVENGQGDAIARLRVRLDGIYSGRPQTEAADRCLADVVRAYGIPRAVFDALLEGFEWDVAARTYETLADVEEYGERVAGSVGAMMAALMGVRDAAMVERACDLGVAMQLTNIGRDIGEDARQGRLYVPRAWLREEGIDPEVWLANPEFSPAIARLTERLLSRAEELYRRADQAIARLPATVRPAIFAARLLYAEIGKVIRAQGYDSISKRASTTAARKAWLVGAAMQRAARPAPKGELAIARGVNRPLVAAIVQSPPGFGPANKRGHSVKDDLNWVMDLFSDLEMRDRTGSRSR
ncbi:phytoene/squalene synthase family protein [Aquidulcibacter sp.]|uniref:phytoene/squalene synthase family protein n=1 Tax=Aquidulcibacter sp. TaxID=2052990 RepID=UPI0025C01BF8|nr:phytoene/squalene synthase family protein [Aquidulcibacter sp.]MCA3695630.1 phytoene/squalene synthase family protein [Aquidulcibacter sp.]